MDPLQNPAVNSNLQGVSVNTPEKMTFFQRCTAFARSAAEVVTLPLYFSLYVPFKMISDICTGLSERTSEKVSEPVKPAINVNAPSTEAVNKKSLQTQPQVRKPTAQPTPAKTVKAESREPHTVQQANSVRQKPPVQVVKEKPLSLTQLNNLQEVIKKVELSLNGGYGAFDIIKSHLNRKEFFEDPQAATDQEYLGTSRRRLTELQHSNPEGYLEYALRTLQTHTTFIQGISDLKEDLRRIGYVSVFGSTSNIGEKQKGLLTKIQTFLKKGE